MAGLPRIPAADVHRMRRFDAVVLGASLPGLVAAIRLGQAGARVLVVEEEAAAGAHPGWREPFLLWDAEPGGVLGACLRALAVPLIDQRRLLADDFALQLVTPRARLDWGRAGLAASELASWGLAKPDEALTLLRALGAGAEGAREALLGSLSPRSRRAAGLDLGPAAVRPAASPHAAPDPAAALRQAAPALRGLLRQVALALCEAGGAELPGAAELRLLGGVLGGGAILAGDGGLRDLLWRRLASLFGERRRIPGPLRLVGTAQLAAIEAPGVPEIFAGRALLLNAPLEALAAAHDGPAPALLRSVAARHRRALLLLRAPAQRLPEAMAQRLLVLGGEEPLRIARLPVRRGDPHAELLVSLRAPIDALEAALHARLESAVLELAPFCAGQLERRSGPAARWDRDDLLPELGRATPDAAAGLRLSSRPLIVALERSAAGATSFEGDLLLGWRAGDELAAELCG
jgi:hypothetical protein